MEKGKGESTFKVKTIGILETKFKNKYFGMLSYSVILFLWACK